MLFSLCLWWKFDSSLGPFSLSLFHIEIEDYPTRVSLTSPLAKRSTEGIVPVTSEGLCTAFQEVNPAIITPILEFLGPEDLCVLACVSKRWNDEASHNVYWKPLFRRHYGLPIPADRQYEPGFIKRLFLECTPRVGDLLEVVDTVKKWVVCRIVGVLNRRHFLVYFEGWSEPYIMWVDKIRDSQRIRPIHDRYLTGIGTRGPVHADHFKAMVNSAKFILSQPQMDHPPPPYNYLPSIYFIGENFTVANIRVRVHDPARVRRLQEVRNGEFVPSKVLQSQVPPLWLGAFPHASDEPFYQPQHGFGHEYTHDPYPGKLFMKRFGARILYLLSPVFLFPS